MKSKHKTLIIYFFCLIGIIVWLGIVLLAPYFKSQDSGLNALFYAVFSPVCHQISSRSFFLFGHPLAVCGRCFGIYSGFFIGTLFYPFLKGLANITMPKTKTFIFFSIPIVLDTFGNFLRLWMTSNIPRFFIGFLWGLILPFYFIPGITGFFLSLGQQKKNLAEKHLEIQTQK